MKSSALAPQPERPPRKKAKPVPVTEAAFVAAKQQRFQEVFGGVDWEKAKQTASPKTPE